jgi:hypothetical protein
MYQSVRDIENGVVARMTELSQAERDAAQHCGMAFDGNSAEEIYRNALDHCGISRRETVGLNVSSLKALLKYRPTPGSQAWRSAPAMAFDTAGDSVLDDILADTRAR